MPTPQETASKLKMMIEWQDVIMKMEEEGERLQEVLQPSFESPFFRRIFNMEEAYTNVVAYVIGDTAEWLNWYRFDNGWGRRGLEAGYGKKLKPINTLSDLLTLIEAPPPVKKKK